MDLAEVLVKHLVGTESGRIPGEVVEATKRCVLDTLACVVAGSSAVETKIESGLLREWGGKPESTVLNHGYRVPAPQAAWINATMARALDIDNVLEKASCHIHASVVPGALAMAERIGSVSGRDFTTAVILGSDVVARMAMSNRIPTGVSGMNSTYQYGTFGTAAACARLLRLNEAQFLDAMGIAYSLVTGNSQCLLEGSMTTRLAQGTAAHAGVLAAMLAAKGMTGARQVFEGRFGYYNVHQRGEFRPEAITDGLGTVFEGTDVSIKRHACCMHAHTSIDSVLSLVRAHGVKVDDIRGISLGLNRQGWGMVGAPLDRKRRPDSVAAAQFSAPFVVASALLRGRVFIDAFEGTAITDPRTLALAEKVDVTMDPEVEAAAPGRCSPTKVAIALADGTRLEDRLDEVKGHPSDPLSFDDIAEKFVLCNGFANEPLSEPRIRQLIEAIANLDGLADVSAMADLMAPGTTGRESSARTVQAAHA